LHPERRAAPRPTGDFGGCGKRETVPGHRETARGDEGRDEQRHRSTEKHDGEGERGAARHPREPERPDPGADDVRPAAGPDPERRCQHLHARQHGRRLPAREPALVVEEEDDEPRQHDLRDEVKAAPGAEQPEAPVPQRLAEPARLEQVLGRLGVVDDERAEHCAAHRQEAEKEQPVFEPQRRQRQGGDEAAEGNRGLPHAERQAALGRREPVHHRSTAGRVHACSCRAGQPEQDEEPAEAARVDGGSQGATATGEPGGEHGSLAHPVGQQAPRQQRQQAADPDTVEHEADLNEAEPVGMPDLRREHGQPNHDRGVRRLRGRSRREHEPAVATRRSYRPKGLNGFGLVETITLFVSR
jgi:hypothetical protein